MTTTTPGPALGTEQLFRVERGLPTDEETAALAVVLLLRMSGTPDPADDGTGPATAHWRSSHRTTGHRPPRSWRTGARPGEPGPQDPG
ncbi:acyl-CoA carboxylase subunit epsilon [Streptomyces sp. NBC_00237]|uniref:acyl-CoA carboxylase subunit epsilon n=1 Tax=Streptomyces sp. NBC_00237 TaxID=2975687 RepID=UPI002252D121|nr:acyl-CoA carboxylase subunit epsilon [Streptomyces sp. NBC_00237]MCX5203222.1 acyl-CoA carboxylase subunit epsilon [Streptomyces sp. NBC_00237]